MTGVALSLEGTQEWSVPDVGKPVTLESRNVSLVGYHDLDKRPGFKLAIHRSGGNWFLYVGHQNHRGWSVLDVTDPASPQLKNFIPGPENTNTSQVQAAGGRLICALEWANPGLGGVDGQPFGEGILIWDVASDPVHPKPLGQYKTGGLGTHRNFFAGGPFVYLAAAAPGYYGKILLVVDISDPSQPKEISRWSLPDQKDLDPPRRSSYFHGPAYVWGERAYLSYGRAGAIILDVSQISLPRMVSRVSFGDLGKRVGCHSAVPIPGRRLLVANSEPAIQGRDYRGYEDSLNYTAVIDVSEETDPVILSFLPPPVPSRGLPYGSYYDKGGRFGVHNQHHYQGHPDLKRLEKILAVTYFNAGLRLFSIEDPYQPTEVGSYVPENPKERRGRRPKDLVTHFEDVLIDSRGYIYCTDSNHGLFVLRYDGELS